MINGISHITLIVHDLEIAGRFLQDVLDAKEVYASGEKRHSIAKEKYFLAGMVWICIMEGDSLPGRTYSHIAFSVPDSGLDACVARIKAAGAEILPGRPRGKGEGQSVYFYDFDNHLFELHTGTLEERLLSYSL
jgi:catechol 2,3-dioxygenase-like lactoylglutathione lyase family enzyme